MIDGMKAAALVMPTIRLGCSWYDDMAMMSRSAVGEVGGDDDVEAAAVRG